MTTTSTETWTVEQAAKQLGIGRSLAYELCRRQEIPALKFGSRWVIPKAALARMLQGSCPVTSADEESVPPIGGTR